MISTMKHSGEGKFMEMVKRIRVVRKKEGVQKTFKAMKIFWIILQCKTHVIVALRKPIAYAAATMKPNIGCGLSVIMLCHCRFTHYNSCATLEGTVRKGTLVRVGDRERWKISLPSSQCWCETKTLLNKKITKSTLKNITRLN